MKLVVFSEKLWPEGGGGELATYLVLKLLASTRDFDIEVYTGTEKPMPIPGALVKVVEFLKASNKVQLFLNILRSRQFIEKAIEKADIVYIPRFSYPIIPLAKKLGKKVVVHLHDYQPVSYTAVILSTEVDKPMSDFKRTTMLESKSGNILRTAASTIATPLTKVIRRWVGIADKIICVSRRHEEILLKLAPEYKRKTVVIYNPPPPIPKIEKDLLDKPMLLYVGGDSYVKGFHVLLKALKILGRRKQTNFKLVLTNKYNQKSLKIIEDLKKKYSLDIQVLGRISYEELVKLHSKAWVSIFPSIFEETFGYVVLESMLLGTIPIATHVGGVPEIVSGTPGELFLVEPNNPGSIVVKVLNVLSLSREEVTLIGTTLRENALTRFNEDSIKRMLANTFYSLN